MVTSGEAHLGKGIGEHAVADVSATRTQHAIRLLAILHACGEQPTGSDPPEAVQVVRSEKRLQALDFWLRNPDYLADEILTMVEAGILSGDYVRIAASMLTDPEPALHHYPMPKWFYGAYEATDDAVALLEAYGLAFARRRGAPPKRLQTQFFLTRSGAERAGALAITAPLDWYSRQAGLVHLVAGHDSGTRLKDRQYAQDPYAKAGIGEEISSVAERVRIRLEAGATDRQAVNGAAVQRHEPGRPVGATSVGEQMELWPPSAMGEGA